MYMLSNIVFLMSSIYYRAVNLYKLGPINGPFPIWKTLQNSQFSKLKNPNFINCT